MNPIISLAAIFLINLSAWANFDLPLRDNEGVLSPKQTQFCHQAEPNQGALSIKIKGAIMTLKQADSFGTFTCIGNISKIGVDLICKQIDAGGRLHGQLLTNAQGLGAITLFSEPPQNPTTLPVQCSDSD